MHRVTFHRRAARALKRIPAERSRQIRVVIRGLANTDDPTRHRNVRAMSGPWLGQHRLRVGEYRVIFMVMPRSDGQLGLHILITDIGPRGGVY